MCGEQQREACFASLCCPPSTKLSSFVAAVLCHRIVLRTSSFITKILCCSFTWKWRKFWLNSLSIQELKLTNTLLNSPRRRVQQFDLTSSPSLRILQMVTYRHWEGKPSTSRTLHRACGSRGRGPRVVFSVVKIATNQTNQFDGVRKLSQRDSLQHFIEFVPILAQSNCKFKFYFTKYRLLDILEFSYYAQDPGRFAWIKF